MCRIFTYIPQNTACWNRVHTYTQKLYFLSNINILEHKIYSVYEPSNFVRLDQLVLYMSYLIVTRVDMFCNPLIINMKKIIFFT